MKLEKDFFPTCFTLYYIEWYRLKVKELQELDDKIHQELPFYTDLEKELKQTKSVENDQYNEIKQRILKKESELKEIITKQRENLITELDKLWKPREEEMSRQLKDTAEKCDALTRNKSQIEETFQSHNALAVFTASGKLNNDLPTRPVNAISEQKLVFSEKKIIDDNKEAFGSILTIPVFKVTETFTSEESIWKIETFADNSNILCLYGESTIKSFKLKNSKCETTSVAGVDKVNIVDMTKAKDNTLLFTVVTSSEIKCLSTFTPDSKIETFTSISPLYARGIHATNKNILIGFKDNGCLVTCLNESHGINRPLCLNINQDGQLQIGCSKIGTKDGLSKLHTVDISL
ncbi:unnamed protein product [Mytilus edulis]|uniref:Uncharacterized protein n=1 Tax=Mytilus edulis TaxID=6550 RepID=A0A8S3TH91_MYTED|nr:unnamed protein product [Mytilus edulis]